MCAAMATAAGQRHTVRTVSVADGMLAACQLFCGEKIHRPPHGDTNSPPVVAVLTGLFFLFCFFPPLKLLRVELQTPCLRQRSGNSVMNTSK